MTDEEAAAVFKRLPALVNGDIPLVRRGRHLTTTFLIGAGAVPVLAAVREGAIAGVTVSPPPMRSWRFAVRAVRRCLAALLAGGSRARLSRPSGE